MEDNTHPTPDMGNNDQPINPQSSTPSATESPVTQGAEETTPLPPATQPNAPVVDDDDEDYIATPEEVAAEARRSAERRAKKHTAVEEKTNAGEFGDFVPADSLVDPYEEPDPTIPWPKHAPSTFLSRGCRNCPMAYQPVSSVETCSCSKVTSTNWLAGVRQPSEGAFDVVEVRFKNNRKEFFRLPDGIDVQEGDVVAVEGQPGHDIGIVTLTGEVCRIQLKKHKIKADDPEIKRLFRRAKPADIEKWAEAIAEEDKALQTTRRIADSLGLVMKVDDVEMQGDHSKAIFYYTADDRVDFRSLIKVLAEEFKVRIEMKQIGVRQEASRIGGLGTCGRELCCCTWLTNFKSVTTSSAKVQQIHPNPQKLAGQCGKLKCCLNFEAEIYADALKQFPPAGTPIRFKKGLALYKKTDVLRGIMWYAYEGESELYAITAENVKKIIEMNRNQQYPETLEEYKEELMGTSGLQQESSNSDFENELRRMADPSDNGTTSSDGVSPRNDRHHANHENARNPKGTPLNDDRRSNDRMQRKGENRDNEPARRSAGRDRQRPPRDSHQMQGEKNNGSNRSNDNKRKRLRTDQQPHNNQRQHTDHPRPHRDNDRPNDNNDQK